MPSIVVLPPATSSTNAVSQLRGSTNVLVIQVAGQQQATGINDQTLITCGQLQQALGLISQNANVYQSLSADMNDSVWIQYSRNTTCTYGDALSLRVQAILGYTDAQMVALFVSASQQVM